MRVASSYTASISKPENGLETTRHRFRAYFTRELARCIGKRRSVAESFGLVFTETLDCIPISEDEQGVLYRELLSWAKTSAELFPAVHRSYSQREKLGIGVTRAAFFTFRWAVRLLVPS